MNPELKSVFMHYIINQNVLRKPVIKLNSVIDVVTTVVHFIRPSWFIVLFDKHDTQHSNKGYRTTVAKIVQDLRAEIQEFCEKKGKDIPELSDGDQIVDLAFAVDVSVLIM